MAPERPELSAKGWPTPTCDWEGFLPCPGCGEGCFYHTLPYDPETGHGRFQDRLEDDGFGNLVSRSTTLADPWEEAAGEQPESDAPAAQPVALNPDQVRAVEHGRGPALVVAGAGSGKTRVLVNRILRLVDKLRVSPKEILAITFTRKAAQEMKDRLLATGRGSFREMTVSTFHSLALAICRDHPSLVDRRGTFSVWDESMVESELRRILKEVWASLVVPAYGNLPKRRSDGDMPTVGEVQQFLSKWKRGGLPLHGQRFVAASTVNLHWAAASVIREYELLKAAANAMDFDDMVWRAVWLLEQHPEVRERYQLMWQWLLVDEYQDTNNIQERFLNLLVGPSRNVMVVGDEDQSIFAFNGSNVSHILTFARRFPGTEIIQLGQNYRSSSSILGAAANVIARNKGRRPKRLWTDNDAGWPVEYLMFEDPFEEAKHIAAMIAGSIKHGYAASEHAILVRLRRQIPNLQLQLLQRKIPHVTVGYIELHQRVDVRLVLAWLRCFVSPRDFVSGAMCFGSWPKIGAATVKVWQELLVGSEVLMFEAFDALLGRPRCGKDTAKGQAILAFRAAWREFEALARKGVSIRELATWIYEKSGMDTEIEDARSSDNRTVAVEAEARNEFRTAFIAACPATEMRNPFDGITSFLDALATNARRAKREPAVTLSTCHSAKGLEWDHVWVAGMVEGVMPCLRDKDEDFMDLDALPTTAADGPVLEELEEERRLAYVAMTRGRHRLVLCHYRRHQVEGTWMMAKPSRFLAESRAAPEVPVKTTLEIDEDAGGGTQDVERDFFSELRAGDERPPWDVITPEEEAEARRGRPELTPMAMRLAEGAI
jgi:DNA helicase-2/ATP-dependent DNA helicase PcrA